MTQAPLSKAEFVQQLAHALTTILNTTAGVEKVLEQFRGPKTHMVANLTWTLTYHLLKGRAIGRVQSRRTARNRSTLQTLKPLFIDRVYPQANGVFIAVELLGNVGAGLAIEQKQYGMIAFA